jgi:hypothetical protein
LRDRRRGLEWIGRPAGRVGYEASGAARPLPGSGRLSSFEARGAGEHRASGAGARCPSGGNPRDRNATQLSPQANRAGTGTHLAVALPRSCSRQRPTPPAAAATSAFFGNPARPRGRTPNLWGAVPRRPPRGAGFDHSWPFATDPLSSRGLGAAASRSLPGCCRAAWGYHHTAVHRRGADGPACRPGSVRRQGRRGDHPSTTTVAGRLQRSTRALGRAALERARARCPKAPDFLTLLRVGFA